MALQELVPREHVQAAWRSWEGKNADRYDRPLSVIAIYGSISKGGKFILGMSPLQPIWHQQRSAQQNKRSADKDRKIS